MRRFFKRRTRGLVRFFDGWSRTIGAPAKWIGYSLRRIGLWIASWYRSRMWRRLLYGLPAILVFSLSGYFLIITALTRPSQLALKYTKVGRAATNAGDSTAATLYLERAFELGVRNPNVLFDLAKAAERSGDESRMVAVLKRLAPDDRPVHAPAHLWRAIQYLARSPVTGEDQKAAENQLRFALQMEPSNVNAHALLGDLYFQRGFYEGAVNHLGQASKKIAFYQLKYAKACAISGRATEARQSANLAKALGGAKLAENPSDVASRLELADALQFLEQHDAAIRVLQQGYPLTDDPSPLRAAVARVYLSWADHVLRQRDDVDAERVLAFELISRGMLANPDDPEIFGRMMVLIEVDDRTSRKAQELLLDNIALGRSVGMSHLLLGTSMQESGKAEQAGFHLQQAFQLLPQAPLVANNLAWHFVHQENPSVEKAKSLIDAVILRNPDVPAYIDTRAHVYLAMEKWEEAITDFQISMTQFANEASVHQGLAQAYRSLEMTELADRHETISFQLAEQALISSGKDGGNQVESDRVQENEEKSP